MTIKQAIKYIVDHWEEINDAQNKLDFSRPGRHVVWAAKSDLSASYEVDEEWIGISPQGNIIWAYASGCSCWDGQYSEDKKPTIKELTLKHGNTPKQWEDAIIKFVQTKKLQEL